MTGKVIAIVLVLGVGLFIGSRGATHKNEPVTETQTQVAVADSTPTAPVAVAETAPIQKTTATPKKSAPVAPTPAPVITQPDPKPAPSKLPTRIDGLASINPLAALQENWDTDIEKDGPVIDISYLDSNGDMISNDATAKMPISADVKLYAGSDPLSKKTKLVYSGHFDSNQIVYNFSPKIRIPEEQINIDPNTDYDIGLATVTIHTPEQGDFSATDSFVVLYEK